MCLTGGVGNGKQLSRRLVGGGGVVGIHVILVSARTRIIHREIAQLRFRLNLFKVTTLTDIRH